MDNINPQKHIAAGAYSQLIGKAATSEVAKPLSLTQTILSSICNFLGIKYSIDQQFFTNNPALQKDLGEVAQKVEDLFEHVNQSDPKQFNDGVLALRELLNQIGDKHAQALPEKFSANALIDFVFKEVAKELSPEEVLSIYDRTDAELAEYDSTAMAAILKGIRDSVLEGAQPKIHFGEEALITLNTRVECFGSHFQTTVAKSSDKKSIGSGATHSVYSLPYAVGHFEGEQTSERIKAFKPIQEKEAFQDDMIFFPIALGLETTPGAAVSTRFIERNLVVSGLDNKLNFGVIARTQPAIQEGQRGIVMELYAPDKKGAATDAPKLKAAKDMHSIWEGNQSTIRTIHADARYRRDSVSLQLIDFITGQVDRHQGNYLILLGDNNKYLGLRGIDSDASSGAVTKPVWNHPQVGPYYHHQVRLPKVIDQKQYEAIMALKDSDIDDLCNNRLTPAEINANKERLTLLKDHVQTLKQNGKVIDASAKAWGTPNVKKSLCSRDNPVASTNLNYGYSYSSYYGREHAKYND